MKNKEQEYYEYLHNKYLIKPTSLTDKGILIWSEKEKKQTNKLLKHYGASSWFIEEFLMLVYLNKISNSHFRELVRYEMNENFQQRIKDLYNGYNSQLKEATTNKMGRKEESYEVIKLRGKVELLKKLLDESR